MVELERILSRQRGLVRVDQPLPDEVVQKDIQRIDMGCPAAYRARCRHALFKPPFLADDDA